MTVTSSLTADELLEVDTEEVERPGELSFAKNVFLPLSTACMNSCNYCAFFDEPGEAEVMTEKEVRERLEDGRKLGCTEALFSFGTHPETYPAVRDKLEEMGYGSGLDYLQQMCKVALEVGILPHSNPGYLTYDELGRLGEVNASMGLMLESTAEIEAHEGYETKQPERRIEVLENAGEQEIPFTTGILVGVGESWRDRADSILEIGRIHEEFGHIQEVIVQNVVPNERSDYDKPSVEEMERVVAMARYGLPDEVEVQVPPNLTENLPRMVEAGVGDFGGVSPVTSDYINPEYDWPEVRKLEEVAERCGLGIEKRLPVYERYVNEDWLSGPVLEVARQLG
ncbi:MAG: 7,8-didemethyl-8-hydroxy-5-deazariboflavin synthase subunit CofG [Halobacteria archaeon]